MKVHLISDIINKFSLQPPPSLPDHSVLQGLFTLHPMRNLIVTTIGYLAKIIQEMTSPRYHLNVMSGRLHLSSLCPLKTVNLY